MSASKVRVIVVTDGDRTAQQAVEAAAHELQLCPLRISAGNPTILSGPEILAHILQAPREPVVVMVDDKGHKGIGPGERVIEYLVHNQEDIEILGVVAVASHSSVYGTRVDYSVTAELEIIKGEPVTKDGHCTSPRHHRLKGDTVQILNKYPQLLVVGCGDPGKMNGVDNAVQGAEVTKKCLELILKGSGNFAGKGSAPVSGQELY